jgi:aryl-phospho-beta-D-glucosidase BglC (GH1 family)
MKRILVILLIFAVAPFLFLISCSNDDAEEAGENNGDNENNGDAGEPDEPEPDQTSEPPEEPKEPFVFSYDFSGKETRLPTPTAQNLPSSWKGFNMLNMFIRGNDDRPWVEEEFEMIAELGFNFVRVPMDYRIWITNSDWHNINEEQIKRIDQVVEYGIKHDIHIMLNFHRAPGFTVASPPERTSLWTDEETQEVFVGMWAFLAARYINVPNEYLSFNFVNEPPDIDEAVYAAVIQKAADAIWAISPDRLLVSDGLSWGNRPSNLIRDMGIAQAGRGYSPFTLTHYQAEWVEGSEYYSLPAWPALIIPSHLYSAGKTDMRDVYAPYIIEHNFNESYYLDVTIGIVSDSARFVVSADAAVIFENLFRSGGGEGEWETEVYREEWDVYQNIWNREYRIEIPAGTKLLMLDVSGGDWMTVSDMKFSPAAENSAAPRFSVTPTTADWGLKIPPLRIDADGGIIIEGEDVRDREWLWENAMAPWVELIESGGGAMIGEWGSYNKTPHDVVLRWQEDNLENFKRADMGWALWNFNASFGIINSGRADVDYEDYNGYRLDRDMLELLLRYVD